MTANATCQRPALSRVTRNDRASPGTSRDQRNRTQPAFGRLYENVYVNVDGVWKIKKLFYRAFWHGSVEEGWAHTRPDFVPNASVVYPDDPYGPDELLENAPRLWPDTTTLPFHYQHPVTGKDFVPDSWGAFPEA